MLDIKMFERSSEGNNPIEDYKRALANRGYPTDVFENLLALNVKRKETITKAEQAKANQNKISQTIPILKKEGKDVKATMEELARLSNEVKGLEQSAAEIDLQVTQLAATLPNKPHPSVPVGTSAEQNKIIKSWGDKKNFGFKPKEHFELGEKLGFLDFERATKVSGARFTFIKSGAARLERALISFFMDLHSKEHGYTEIIPPYIVNSASYYGSGQFPKFTEDVFHLTNTDYYLISTAEVPVTNIFRDEILAETDLPTSYCAFSPCFRSEAGAHGRDTKGLVRQHQFHKVELLSFVHPQQSYEVHEKLTTHAERCLELLELPYQRMLLCTGDMGFSTAKCYDLEVWLPGAQAFREISSCSNFEDFQARRANIRFRPNGGGKPQFVHTLNGSGLAVGRTLIAVLENYQQEDGKIKVPTVLKKYMDGADTI